MILNKRFVRLLIIILTCFSIFSSNAVIASQDDVSVTEMNTLLSGAKTGYSVYRFNIKNEINKKITVNITLNNGSYDERLEIKKQVELMPYESKMEKIFYPNGEEHYSNPTAYFWYNGKLIEKFNLKKGNLIFDTGYNNDEKQVLVDSNMNNNDLKKLFQDSSFDNSLKGKYKLFYFNGSSSEMDKEWISYAQYDSLLYYESTFLQMPESVQTAIIDYVMAGGQLILLASDKNLSKINLFDKSRVYNSNKSEGFWTGYYVGFGLVSVFDEELFDKIKSTPQKTKTDTRKTISTSGSTFDRYNNKKSGTLTFASTDTETNSFFESGMKIYNPSRVLNGMDRKERSYFSLKYLSERNNYANGRLKDYKSIIPPQILSFLVIAFAFIIGPVNFIILKKYDKKILFFLTVPILSCICCFIIFFLYFATEYNRLEIKRKSFSLLDENTNTSLTFGIEYIFSGKTLNNELAFPLSSIVNAKDLGSSMYGRGISRSITLDKMQNFTESWIRPKSPMAYSITTIKQDRSRLELNQKSNEIELLNGLGADIVLVYAKLDDGSFSNKIYYGENIRAGQRGEIKYDSSWKNRNFDRISINDLFGVSSDSERVKRMKNYAERTLKAGEYIVYLKTNPFMKQNIDFWANLKEEGCYIHGIFRKGDSK